MPLQDAVSYKGDIVSVAHRNAAEDSKDCVCLYSTKTRNLIQPVGSLEFDEEEKGALEAFLCGKFVYDD